MGASSRFSSTGSSIVYASNNKTRISPTGCPYWTETHRERRFPAGAQAEVGLWDLGSLGESSKAALGKYASSAWSAWDNVLVFCVKVALRSCKLRGVYL